MANKKAAAKKPVLEPKMLEAHIEVQAQDEVVSDTIDTGNTTAEKEYLKVRAGTETYFNPQHVNIPGVADLSDGPMFIKKQYEKSPTNPAHLEFPTDRWGLTRDVKSSMITMTARVCGSEEKFAVAKETLDMLLSYMEARYEQDRTSRGA